MRTQELFPHQKLNLSAPELGLSKPPEPWGINCCFSWAAQALVSVRAAWMDTAPANQHRTWQQEFPNGCSLPNTPPAPGEDVPASSSQPCFLLPLHLYFYSSFSKRTGSSSQPPHTCPACRPQGTARPAPGTGSFPTSVKASSCHFHLVFPTL